MDAARRQLVLVAAVQVSAMSVWFSTAAVVPSLADDWSITSQDAGWLTTSVQLGFVCGAVVSALLNLPDRLALGPLISACAAAAGATNLLVAVCDGLAAALPLRFLTGMALAGVYPVGAKLIASWFVAGRGLAMGVLVGALTLGSASPHLVNGVSELPWRAVLIVTSALALAGAAGAARLRAGPALAAGAGLHAAYVVEMFRDRRQRLVNIGYFGHMWELYALWTWLPVYLGASLAAWGAGADQRTAVGLVAFGTIGLAGAAGCVIAGAAARRAGSRDVARWALVASGACCVLSVPAFGAPPWLVAALLAIWGFAVIADSAQFSALLSEAADRRYVGTALTAQMAIGFAITAGAIHALPWVADAVGWRWTLAALAPGPVIGAIAMARLAITTAAAPRGGRTLPWARRRGAWRPR